MELQLSIPFPRLPPERKVRPPLAEEVFAACPEPTRSICIAVEKNAEGLRRLLTQVSEGCAGTQSRWQRQEACDIYAMWHDLPRTEIARRIVGLGVLARNQKQKHARIALGRIKEVCGLYEDDVCTR